MKQLLTIFLLLFAVHTYSQPIIELIEFASGLTEPVAIENAGDDRLFIVERYGYIKIADAAGNVLPVDFLDIHNEIESGYNEQGLLGLAFHPDYAVNGYFFVYYTDVDGNSVVSRFSVSTFDLNVADPTTEEIIYTADQPFVNHNGGCIRFGPDGYLYIGFGDGGSAGDPGNRAQNPENKLGKMSRIDVNGALPYEIPADNPFADAVDTLPEIWAIGYRNPWRWSFDRLTNDLWVGDVGQNLVEEVDFEPAGSTGGINYGWRCYEAYDEFNTSGCEDEAFYTFPIMDYPHNYSTGGFAITGGFVYRGADYPGMYGYYLCADFVSGNWWWIYPDGAGGWINERMDDVQLDISSFGEDVNGELYCAELYSGQIFRVTDACGDFMINAVATDYICGVQDAEIDLTINAGESPFEIDWSTGDTDEDITVDAAGLYSVTVTDDGGCERMINVMVNEIPAFTPGIEYDGIILSTDMGVAWQWYYEGEIIDGATNMTYSPTLDGLYSVLVTDANGCSVMSADIFAFETGINPNVFISEPAVYPNPASDEFTIELNSASDLIELNLQISNVVGSIIYFEILSITNGQQLFEINTSEIPTGIYSIQLQGDGAEWNYNLMINR